MPLQVACYTGKRAGHPCAGSVKRENNNIKLNSLATIFNAALDRVNRSGYGELAGLVFPSRHSALVQQRRAALIISRVRIVAVLFALLTPLWIFVDYYAFSWPLWGILASGRLLASLAFGVLARSFTRSEAMRDAYYALSLLLIIPTLFYLFSHSLINRLDMGAFASVLAVGYAFLPFVMVTGLAMFPITALEGVLFASPLTFAVILVGAFTRLHIISWAEYTGSIWLLILIGMVATLSGMMQLHFMMALVVQASHDNLTKGFTRRTGEELLELLFRQAERQKTPLALVFMDLDDFKSINDSYGHDEGDSALRQAAEHIQRVLRRGDILVRWGGEEFLIIMPNTDATGARSAIDRLRQGGLGLRPNGLPLTASMGVAERLADGTAAWMRLVDVADQRMYQAKQRGKNRVVLVDDREVA
ncbi:MAG TPA: GGDEF domain-containing protein [Nitrococcus sp.]|nr:GGDEF domain-containing protein [Nitrococcus sp.]